jgi:methionyl-tRNA formyltransferase
MRVGLLCEEAAGARMLQVLARSTHELTVLLTTPGSPVWTLAGRLGHCPLSAQRVREPGFAAELARAGVEVLLNVHSLYILPEAVLRVPALGAYNLHPGPLPRYAGLNAPSWAIFYGEDRHGVTVHRMEPGIDTGNIVYEEHFPIESEDTGLSLALRCVEKGVVLLERLLEMLAADPAALTLRRQDMALRRYFGRGVPQGGRISWCAPARRIHDFVRACDYHPFKSPWGAPRARLGDSEVEVLKVGLTGVVCDAAPGTLRVDTSRRVFVAAADEWLWLRRTAVKGKPLAPEELAQSIKLPA